MEPLPTAEHLAEVWAHRRNMEEQEILAAPRRTLSSEPNWRLRGMPKIYLDCQPTSLSERLSRFYRLWPRDKNMLVMGANGRGKSHFASLLMKRHRGYWMNAGMWQTKLLRLRGGTLRADDTEHSLIRHAAGLRYLIVDDLWSCNRTNYALQPIQILLNQRIENKLPTVVTLDYTLEAVAEESPALASRLGSFPRIVIEGNDRRLTDG